MDAVTIISPPAGAANRLLLVSTRPEVHAESRLRPAPWPRTTRSKSPRASRGTLRRDVVIVSISPVPNMPRPLSYRQYLVSRLPPGGPLKVSDQTIFHGRTPAWVAEQLRQARTMKAPSPPASSRGERAAPVRSLASYRRRPGPASTGLPRAASTEPSA